MRAGRTASVRACGSTARPRAARSRSTHAMPDRRTTRTAASPRCCSMRCSGPSRSSTASILKVTLWVNSAPRRPAPTAGSFSERMGCTRPSISRAPLPPCSSASMHAARLPDNVSQARPRRQRDQIAVCLRRVDRGRRQRQPGATAPAHPRLPPGHAPARPAGPPGGGAVRRDRAAGRPDPADGPGRRRPPGSRRGSDPVRHGRPRRRI